MAKKNSTGNVQSDREKTARLHRLLRRRHLGSKGSNGAGWAYFNEVPLATGYGHQQRFADALAMSLYPSRGLVLHGYEVKASRSDWLKELHDPSKADGFIKHCDYWWLVTEPDVVEEGELPATWGLLVRRGTKLVSKVKAPELDPQPYTRDFLSGILRAAAVEHDATPAELTEAVAAAEERVRKYSDQRHQQDQERNAELRDKIRAFEDAAGIRLDGSFPVQYDAAEVGRVVRLVLEGKVNVEQLERRFRRLSDEAEKISELARKSLSSPEKATKRGTRR